LGCTVTVTDTASGTKSPPTGTVSFSFTSQPSGSTATVSPCVLVPSTTRSEERRVGIADTAGRYTNKANKTASALHTASAGRDTVTSTTRPTSSTLDWSSDVCSSDLLGCTVTVTDTASGTKSPPTGTVSFSFTSQPSGSTATVSPCVLVPSTT